MCRSLIFVGFLFLFSPEASHGQELPIPEASPPAIANCNFCVPDCSEECWTDNLTVFIGLDGAKQPQDVGINALFGGRAAVNLGLQISRDWGLGVQVGTAIAASDAAVGVLEVVDGADSRTQSFTTLGLFQRRNLGLHWGLVYDILHQRYYDDTTLHQLRGRVGAELTQCDQVGLAAMFAIGPKQNAQIGGTTVRLSPIDQVAAYWSHRWQSGGITEGWLGFADGHGEVIHVLPGNPRRKTAPLFGSSLNLPLNDHLAVYGQANFILPPDSGTVDAYLGMVYTFGRGGPTRRNQYAPLLDVAGSPSFAVDLAR